jgi:tetratricopeptide (TPR) repeat protein
VAGGLAVLVLLAAVGLVVVRHPDGADRAASVSDPASRPAPAGVQSAGKPLAPRIFIAPFTVANEPAIGVTGSQLAARMATALARFDELSVVTRLDGDVDYVVSGTLSTAPAGISAATILTDRSTGRVIWSSKLTAPRNPIQPSLAIDELVGDVAVAIAQPYGVVMSDRLARTDRADDGFPCLIRSFNYWREFATTAHAEIRDCLEALTQRYPTYGLAHAMLTFTYLDEDGLGFSVDPDSPSLDKAVKASAMAVQLAPTSARAKQALQLAYFATGQMERAIETGERAMTLNPLDTDVRAVQGMVLIVAGKHQHGARLIEESAAHNAAYPPWYDLYLALAAFQAGNDAAMRTLIKRVDLPGHPLAALLGLIAGGADGSPEARQAALADLRTRLPELVAEPTQVLQRILPNPALVEQLVDAGRAAGLQDQIPQ